jgi:hypothetical protein
MGVPSVVADAVPDLGPQHAVASVRVGARAGRRIWRWSVQYPAAAAVILWLTVRWIYTGVPAASAPWFPWIVASWWAYLFAYGFTLWTFVGVATALISPTPTHRAVNGRWQPTRREPWRTTGPGYARIKAAAEHLTREERRARRDIDRATRTLGRMGAKRRRRWERQWVAEDAYGAGRSKPGSFDHFLMGRATKPKAKAVKPKAPKGKQARKQADAEFKEEMARIDRERAARGVVGLPMLDPSAGPPVAPVPVGTTRQLDPMVAEWNQRAEVVEARTHQTLAQLNREAQSRDGWVGYTPPPAPLAPISVTEDTP